MSFHYNKQSQFELFPDAPGAHVDVKRSGFFRTTLTFSLDNLVVFVIVVTMLLIVAFSLGVERGKFVVRLKERPYKIKIVSALLAPQPIEVTKVVPRPQPLAAMPTAPVSNLKAPVVSAKPGVLKAQAPSALSPAMSSAGPGTRTAMPVMPQLRRIPVPVQPVMTPKNRNVPKAVPPVVAPQPRNDQFPIVASQPPVIKAGLSLPLSVSEGVERNSSARVTAAPRPVPGVTKNLSPEKKVDNGYTVQVASYANALEVKRLTADLQRRGMKAMLMSKGKYTVVCIGNYSRKADAESASKELKKQFNDCRVRSL